MKTFTVNVGANLIGIQQRSLSTCALNSVRTVTILSSNSVGLTED